MFLRYNRSSGIDASLSIDFHRSFKRRKCNAVQPERTALREERTSEGTSFRACASIRARERPCNRAHFVAAPHSEVICAVSGYRVQIAGNRSIATFQRPRRVRVESRTRSRETEVVVCTEVVVSEVVRRQWWRQWRQRRCVATAATRRKESSRNWYTRACDVSRRRTIGQTRATCYINFPVHLRATPMWVRSSLCVTVNRHGNQVNRSSRHASSCSGRIITRHRRISRHCSTRRQVITFSRCSRVFPRMIACSSSPFMLPQYIIVVDECRLASNP